MLTQQPTSPRLLNATVIVAALGYFVDIYDLLLFSIVRVESLRSLGYDGEALMEKGILLLDMQMMGLLIGGIAWGILGDKKGRLSVLFGSIFMYSIANIANGFVQSVESYAVWRFIAGIGLAGELGAGITLVSETLPREKRGIGTMIVACIGISGAVVAGFMADIFEWRTCYFIGGGLGLSLLALRIGVSESGMFSQVKHLKVERGNFFALIRNRKLMMRYLRCVLIGLPTWYVMGILISFSPEFGKALQIQGEVSAGRAVMFAYGGLVAGDLASGLLSQVLRSRMKVMAIFLAMSGIASMLYLMVEGVSLAVFYGMCLVLGFSVGFWVIFVTIAAEQFGTNIRATVTTTVPNFVRGALVPLTILFQWSRGYLDILQAGMAVGLFTLVIAYVSLAGLKDSFDKELDYTETL
jgi:MFS transporter, putative metabolite:H+ symporter